MGILCVTLRVVGAVAFLLGRAVLAIFAQTWVPTGPMATGRSGHTATLLPNGKVLIAGGACGGYFQTAELYDPGSGTFRPTGPMTVLRTGHSATLLPDGKVLIAGGSNYREILNSSEVYDPAQETFTASGLMRVAREGHAAALLPDGKVLIAGLWGLAEASPSAELYDPLRGVFIATGPMMAPKCRRGCTATLLRSGKVLIAGGGPTGLEPAELYDPETGTFAITGSMIGGRVHHTATLLQDGRVLFAGGIVHGVLPIRHTRRIGGCMDPPGSGDGSGVGSTAEWYDPATGTFTAASPMRNRRVHPSAVALSDGRVLITGGAVAEGRPFTAEVFDPDTGAFIVMNRGAPFAGASANSEHSSLLDGSSQYRRFFASDVIHTWLEAFTVPPIPAAPKNRATATLLPDGRVLITGMGQPNAELFVPAEACAGPGRSRSRNLERIAQERSRSADPDHAD